MNDRYHTTAEPLDLGAIRARCAAYQPTAVAYEQWPFLVTGAKVDRAYADDACALLALVEQLDRRIADLETDAAHQENRPMATPATASIRYTIQAAHAALTDVETRHDERVTELAAELDTERRRSNRLSGDLSMAGGLLNRGRAECDALDAEAAARQDADAEDADYAAGLREAARRFRAALTYRPLTDAPASDRQPADSATPPPSRTIHIPIDTTAFEQVAAKAAAAVANVGRPRADSDNPPTADLPTATDSPDFVDSFTNPAMIRPDTGGTA